MALTAARREAIWHGLRETTPSPLTELEYSSPYELLVAVTLSAQATDKSVNLATRKLFKVANTPQQIHALGVSGLTPFVRSIGLYNAKAANVVAAARILIEQHDGQVPRDRVSLEALPGVGRKTANVVLNVAFGEPTIAVDTHVFRVANRTGIAPGKTVLAVEQKLLKTTPPQYLHDAHHWLILHGRHVCVARKPRCPQCTVAQWCAFKDKTPAAHD
jgi:endonuclease-3